MSQAIHFKLRYTSATVSDDGSVTVKPPYEFLNPMGDTVSNEKACSALGLSQGTGSSDAQWPTLEYRPKEDRRKYGGYETEPYTGTVTNKASGKTVDFHPRSGFPPEQVGFGAPSYGVKLVLGTIYPHLPLSGASATASSAIPASTAPCHSGWQSKASLPSRPAETEDTKASESDQEYEIV